jgi:hypothetical protein
MGYDRRSEHRNTDCIRVKRAPGPRRPANTHANAVDGKHCGAQTPQQGDSDAGNESAPQPCESPDGASTVYASGTIGVALPAKDSQSKFHPRSYFRLGGGPEKI